MRKAIILFVIFGLSGSLWAADPIIGTWDLNLEKSRLPQWASSQESRKEDYRELDSGLIELTIIITSPDGLSDITKVNWPSQGGVVEESSPQGEMLVETLIVPGEWYVTRMRDGKQYGLMHKVVSKDGKTLRQTFMNTFDKDDPIEGVMVFDRQ